MSLLAEMAEAMKRAERGGEMGDIIANIKEADKVIKGEKPNPLCPWCGVNLRIWEEVFHEEHAKDGFCNSKEKECYDLIIDLAENYDRRDGSPDSPDPRKVLNEIIRIALSKP